MSRRWVWRRWWCRASLISSAPINEQGVTVLLIEQNANMALKIADYAYVLETGNITKSGTGAELLADESIKEAYLGKKKS